MDTNITIALIALGGNLPDRHVSVGESLRAAMDLMPQAGLDIQCVSQFYKTPAMPLGSGPDFVNAALAARVEMTPRRILDALHDIEARFGRTRDARWSARVLDLDLIAVGNEVLPDAATQSAWRDLPAEVQATRAPDALILPHPRMQDRSFVLRPLADVAPDWCHPLLGLTVAEMLARRPAEERAAIRPMDGATET